jgi:BirA family biotin operon repressor/biotin-[acetyl-CoA-carboxylase] ligase
VRRIVIVEETGSTNDDARRLADEGADEGTVVIASRQTAGRGRLGRSWDSAEGLGLYLSVLLRPQEPVGEIGRYPIACAIAVCAACREIAGESVVLKWPNDVLAGGAKLAGVLCEMRQDPSGLSLVLGIGINGNQQPGDFPAGLRGSATSLRILRDGSQVELETVATVLLTVLSRTIERLRRDGWPWVCERFLRYAPDATGRRVRLMTGEEGTTGGLDPTGALRILTRNGIELVHAAESVAVIED